MGKALRYFSVAQCTQGTGPGALGIYLASHVKIDGKVAGTSLDMLVTPCGDCISPQNPEVIAEEQPVLCVPIPIELGWDKASSVVKLNGMPAIHSGSKLKCAWGGKITVPEPGQTHVSINK